jgi:MEMO1 family protein
MLRKANFSGSNSFYPSNPSLIRQFFESIADPLCQKQEVIAMVCPHAGYIYSAKTAFKAIEKSIIPDSVIIIGPNHQGVGPICSVMSSGVWEIPGASIPVDTDLAEEILCLSSYAKEDYSAHIDEHSIEVILPMLFYENPKIKIVPIILGNYQQKYWFDLTIAIDSVSCNRKNKLLVVASSDMSHYVSRATAKHKDELAFEMIKALDSKGLLDVVKKEQISMCGSGPVAVALEYSKRNGAKRATMVDYSDSGAVTDNTQCVVSYVSFLID